MYFESDRVHTSRKVGYLRVSTSEQRPDRQIDGLEEICDELHIETLSAVKEVRPIFDAVLAGLQPGDTLVVWDLDRAFRSTRDALDVAEAVQSRGINFEIVRMHMDTSLPEGLLVYTIMAAVGEFERQNLARRTREGLAAARLRGKRLGRPPKLSDRQLEAIRVELKKGARIKDVAARYGVWPWTLSRSLKRAEPPAEETSSQ